MSTYQAVEVHAVEPGVEAPATATPRPEHIPEKFWDAEAGVVRIDEMAKSYSELEKVYGHKQAATPAAPSDEAAPATEQVAPADAKQAVEAAGVNYAALEQEMAEKGELSPESFEALNKAGFPKEVVDRYIGLLQAEGQRVYSEMVSIVGGEEGFEKATAWAKSAYTPEQIAAFNASMDSNDKARMQQAMSALKMDYERANGSQPRLLVPQNSQNPGGEVYQSMAQLLADQNTNLYRTDPAERERVKQKLLRSQTAGKI